MNDRTLNFSTYSSPLKTDTDISDIIQWEHSSQRVTNSDFDVSVADYDNLEKKGKGISLAEDDEPLHFDKVIPNRQSCSPCLVDKRSHQIPDSHNLDENSRPLYLISTDSKMNSPDPVSSPPKSEANFSSSAASKNENSQRDHQLSQQSHQTQQSQQQPIPGTRHITSLHFIPSLPHDAHHTPVPPSSRSDAISIGGRSYTSVNLQLRQPSFISQPPINIRGSGSSLSYSTSSLDHKHGSRSSLHISIGPAGGSISAMRTNLRTNNQSDTAFQIYYSNEKDETVPSCSTTYPSMYSKENDDIFSNSSTFQGTSQTFQPDRRQYQNYISNLHKSSEYVPSPKPRRTSLPETTGPPPHPVQNIHYHPTSPHVFDTEYPSHPPLRQAHQATTEWNIDPLLVEGREGLRIEGVMIGQLHC